MKKTILTLMVVLLINLSYSVTEAEFNSKFKPIATQNAELLISSKDKDIVLLIGNTGAGKSTTLNFLKTLDMGISIVDGQPEFQNPVNLQPSDYANISSGGDSNTLIPKFMEIDGTIIYDLAGWKDTRNTVDNLIGAAFVQQIIGNAKTVRVVFVADESSVILDRGTPFKAFLNNAEKVFSDVIPDIGKSSIIVVTKAVSYDNGIWDFLKRKLTESCFQTDLLLNIWSSSKVLPFSKGKLDNGERQAILTAIHGLEKTIIEPQQKIKTEYIYNGDIQQELTELFQRINENAIAIVLARYDSLQKVNSIQLDQAKVFLDGMNVTVNQELSKSETLSSLFKNLHDGIYQIQKNALPAKINEMTHPKYAQLGILIKADTDAKAKAAADLLAKQKADADAKAKAAADLLAKQKAAADAKQALIEKQQKEAAEAKQLQAIKDKKTKDDNDKRDAEIARIKAALEYEQNKSTWMKIRPW
jgi:energy-coupling factor transporter ATP-binding protein EcfA2